MTFYRKIKFNTPVVQWTEYPPSKRLMKVRILPGVQMAYQEKNFQTEFGKHNRVHGVFELKITKKKSIAFSVIRESQHEGLHNSGTKTTGCYFKLTDLDPREKPFDCFHLFETPAFVVVMFYKPRVKKDVYYIEYDKWIHQESIHPRKSMKESECAAIALRHETYIRRKEQPSVASVYYLFDEQLIELNIQEIVSRHLANR